MGKGLTLGFLLLNIIVSAQTRVIDSLRKVISEKPSLEISVKAKSKLALRLFESGDAVQSQQVLGDLLKEAIGSGSDLAMGEANKTAGTLHFYESHFDSALYYYEKALVYMRKAGDKEGMAKCLCNIGNIHGMRQDIPTAQEYYRKALLLEEELGVKEGTYVPLNNLAMFYLRMNIASKARYYYLKAAEINKEKGNMAELSTTYDGLANLYNDIRKYDSAMTYARMAKDLAAGAGNLPGYAYAHTNIASIHQSLGNMDSAIYYLRQALPYSRTIRDKRLEFAALSNLAAAYVLQNNSDSALYYLEQALPLRDELHVEDYDRDFLQITAEYYYRKGDYKQAYEHFKNATILRDSAYQVEMNARIVGMQEKFETHKKERENRLLQSENEKVRTTRNLLIVILGLALLSIVGGVIAYVKIRRAHKTIRKQKELVEQKQQEIIDSINYAKRIQYALLASQQLLKKYLPEHFVLFKPKDVVSGDFYWASPTDDGFAIVAGDCTGHGVPGAFMSLLNITKLGQVINEQKITRPDLVLNKVRDEIIRSLNPEGRSDESRDGMDAVLCKFRLDQLKLEYAAANNSFYIVRNKKVLVCKADKMPVGKGHDDTLPFTFNEINLEKGDMVYMFTDGFADQFGGPLGKKFKNKQLEHLLVSLSADPLEKQKQSLEAEFEKWRGALEQVDDVCVIGVRI